MKIGRNNFRPPPAVESSVVRLVPKKPRPQVSWAEWDGLLRVCFVRKNKTLRAGFLGTSTVMEMLEANYKTYCAQNNIAVDDGPAEQNVVTAKSARREPKLDGIVKGDHETPSAVTLKHARVKPDRDAIMVENDETPRTDDNTAWFGFDEDEQDEEAEVQPTDTMEVDDENLPIFFQDKGHNEKARKSNAKPGSKRNRKGKVAMLIKEKVNRVLDETELGDKRARMCDEGDFLKLLWAFNKEGIHFS